MPLHLEQKTGFQVDFLFIYLFLLFSQPYSLRKGETKQQKDVGAMC